MHPLTVTLVANDLGVSEYEVFALAHRTYFQTEPDPVLLEKQFGAWLMGTINLPFYVLYFLENGLLSA